MAAGQALTLARKLSQGGEKLLSAFPGDEALDGQAHRGTESLLPVGTAWGRGGGRGGSPGSGFPR